MIAAPPAMLGATLPAALVCAALGLALSFASERWRWPAFAAALGSAALGHAIAPAIVPPGPIAFWASWTTILFAAGLCLIGRPLDDRLAIGLAIVGGLCAGTVVGIAGQPVQLAFALPLIGLMIPGAWAISKRYGIAVKVLASWLVAVALLSAALSFVPTPGYAADHLE